MKTTPMPGTKLASFPSRPLVRPSPRPISANVKHTKGMANFRCSAMIGPCGESRAACSSVTRARSSGTDISLSPFRISVGGNTAFGSSPVMNSPKRVTSYFAGSVRLVVCRAPSWSTRSTVRFARSMTMRPRLAVKMVG